MTDAMAYSSSNTDPISVAAYIARSYRLNNGMKGEDLVSVFNESVRIGEEVLKGRSGLSLQRAMDMVEIARRGERYAKFIPRDRDIRKSILVRSPIVELEELPIETRTVKEGDSSRGYANLGQKIAADGMPIDIYTSGEGDTVAVQGYKKSILDLFPSADVRILMPNNQLQGLKTGDETPEGRFVLFYQWYR